MNIAAAISGAAVGAGTQTGLVPSLELVSQALWRGLPIAIPSVDAIWSAYMRGWVPDSAAAWGLASHGVNLGPRGGAGGDANRSPLWQGYRKLLQSRPDPLFVWSAEQRGLISDIDRDTLLSQAGADMPAWATLVRAYKSYLTPTELHVAANRGLITPQQYDAGLMAVGGYNQLEMGVLSRLREEIPGPSDLIRFAVREAFSPAVANPLKYYDEFPAPIKPWMEAQGYFAPLGFDIISDGVTRPATWIDLHWASHWQPISPTQSYTMLHRLRASRIARYRAQGFDVAAFGVEDVRRWLKVSDYPPGIRDYLAAIAYNPLRLIDIRRALQLKLPQPNGQPVDRQWAVEQFLDRGSHPDDAQIQADLALATAKDAAAGESKRQLKRHLQRFYGLMFAGYEQGLYTRDHVHSQVDSGLFEPEYVDFALDTADQAVRQRLVDKTIARVRREYIEGGLTDVDARRTLLAVPLQPGRVDQFLQEWSLEFTLQRRTVATDKILAWYRRGIVGVDEAKTRLSNIGWTAPDQALYLDEVDRMVLDDQARAVASAVRARKSQAAELQRIIDRQEALLRKLQGDLRRISPINTLSKWFKGGIVNERYVRNRLGSEGYTIPEIDYYLAQWYSGNGQPAASPDQPPADQGATPAT